MSAENRLAFLGLPSELLTAMAEMGIDMNSLLEMPEHLYIMQFMEIMQQLPDAVQKPIRVKDASAFNSFLDDSKQSFFKKFLVLSSLNDATWMEPDQRFDGQHYVPPIARLLARPDVPTFVVNVCCSIMQALSTNGERVTRELCKVAALPASIASCIEKVMDDPVTRNGVGNPKLFTTDLIRLFCSIVIKCCTTGGLQPSGSGSDPTFSHAQALLSTCLRLFKRVMPLPDEDASLAAARQPSDTLDTPIIVELIWALGSLLGSTVVPFPQDKCRAWFKELLQYIDSARERNTMHALVCCLDITFARLSAPPAAGASVALDAASHSPEQMGDKQQIIQTLLKLLSEAPCDLGFGGLAQPRDYESEGGRGDGSHARRQLPSPLSTLQDYSLFDLAFQNISNCISNLEIAAHCVVVNDGALLAIISKRLNESASARDARMYISLCETLVDLLCDSNIRHAVSADEPFPSELVEPLHTHIQSDRFRDFWKLAYQSRHAKRLHGGMVVPGFGDVPASTLKQLANRDEKGSGLSVLGYAAATDNRDAVRMLLQVGSDPNYKGGNGSNAMELTIQHNSNKTSMLSLLQSVKEVKAVSKKEASSADVEACKRVTGKSASELLSPVWDILLDGAGSSPHPDVSFAIFNSLFETVIAVHPVILENLFVVAVSSAASASGRTPRATGSPQVHDCSAAADLFSMSSSAAESSSQGIKVLASSAAERFFKLVGLIAKKFRKIKGVNMFARSALPVILKLLKLPSARPLARLCHKLHLVDPILSELAMSLEFGPSEAAAPALSFSASARSHQPQPSPDDENEEEEEEEEEEDHDDDENCDAPRSPVLSFLRRQASGGPGSFSSAQATPPNPDASAITDKPQLLSLLEELRTHLAPFIVPLSDTAEIVNDLERIACALKAAVVGSAALPQSDLPLMTAQDALSLFFDPKKNAAFMENLDTPQGFKFIDMLRSFMSDDSPSPLPADACCQVIRRARFREIVCPSSLNCDKLKSLIQHSLAMFEEYHDDALALLEPRKESPIHLQAQLSKAARVVHLLPIPADEGCAQYFGSVSSAYRHSISSDFENIVAGLNCGNRVVQESELEVDGAVAAAAALHRRQPGAAAPEFLWQMLTVNFPPPAQGNHFYFGNANGHGHRFNPARPCPEFGARKFSSPPAAGSKGSAAVSGKMSKSQKKRAKQRAKFAEAADSNASDCPTFLSPCDIPRARLFLCYHSDVQPNGNLPPKHLEIDPLRPLHESISAFETKFSGHISAPKIPHSGHECIYPNGCGHGGEHRSAEHHRDRQLRWSCCDQPVSAGVPYCDDARSKASQPVAVFYGSGPDFELPRIPDELRWSLKTLDADIASGRVLLLDVIVAIKSAMPESWLADHGMTADYLSIVFCMNQQEILRVYADALRAWGAADVLESAPSHFSAQGTSQTIAAKAGGGAAAGGAAAAGGHAIQSSDPSFTCTKARSLLQLMEVFAQELQICMTSGPAAELTIDGYEGMQSMFLSARLEESAGRGSASWVQLASQIPQVFSLSSREFLFRRVTGTSEDDLQRLKKDRVNNVERSCILDWAASIATAIRGRRNPLAIQFSSDGVEEEGFGVAVTRSFFCEVADAFSKADTGMWLVDIDQDGLQVGSHVLIQNESEMNGKTGTICGAKESDTQKWPVLINEEGANPRHESFLQGHLREIVIDPQEPLLASNGLYFQPYCASVPMPPAILGRFKVLGIMMAKALHDGRAFPLRISHAIARCICGEDLEFDDLGGIINPHRFQQLKLLRASVLSGVPVTEEVWYENGMDCLDFTLETSIVEPGSRGIVSDISKKLHLVRDGDKVDVTMENVAEYVRAVERMYLGDGVAMQIAALRSGFYSVIQQSHIAVLGPCGLLYQLGCLGVPEFDVQDLRLGLTPTMPYTSSSPQYLWLIEILSNFTERDRRAFVRHFTGAPWLPNGFQGLKIPLTVQRLDGRGRTGGDTYFPVAQTCMGFVKIPLYSSIDKFRDKLLLAIHDKSGFINT